MVDHERIWLEPAGAPDRCWCQDNQWGEEGVEYIRADLVRGIPPVVDLSVVEALQGGTYKCRQGNEVVVSFPSEDQARAFRDLAYSVTNGRGIPPARDVELIAKLRTLTSNTGRDHRTGEEFVHGAGSQEVVDALRSALAALQGIPPVQHVAGGRWRVFEAATERGWWGIELEEAGNDDDPILYPVKIGRNRLDALVAAHNDAIASDGAEACAGEHQVVLDAIQSHNSGEDE